MNIFVSQNDLAYQSNPSLTLVGTCCSKTVLQYFLASPSLHLIIRWIYKFSDRSIRDQCTYTRTNLQYIIPPFLMHLYTKSIITALPIQMIQLWQFLANSLFHVNKPNFLSLLQKAPKLGGRGNKESFSDRLIMELFRKRGVTGLLDNSPFNNKLG